MAGTYNPTPALVKLDARVKQKREKLAGIMTRADFAHYTMHPRETYRIVSTVARYRWTNFINRLIEVPDYLPLLKEEYGKIRQKDLIYAKLLHRRGPRFVFQGKVPVSMSLTLKVDIHETDLSRIVKNCNSLDISRSKAREITTELYILSYMKHENLVSSLVAFPEVKLERITFLTPRAVPMRAFIKAFKAHNREQLQADNRRGVPKTSAPERCVPPELVRYITSSALAGLRYLHEAGFIHRNLDTDAIVAEYDGTIKIGNFNHCRYLKENETANSVVDVNFDFCAPSMSIFLQNVRLETNPEGIVTPELSEASDLFSLGLIVLALIYDKTSFVEKDGLTLPQIVERDQFDTYFAAFKSVNEVTYLDIKADLNMDAGAFTFLNTVLRRVQKTNAAGLLELEFVNIDRRDFPGFKERFVDALTMLDLLPKGTYCKSTTLDRVRCISSTSRFHDNLSPRKAVNKCVNTDKKEHIVCTFPYKFNDGALISLEFSVKVKCPEKVVVMPIVFEYGNEPSLIKALSEIVDNEEDLRHADEGFMVFMPWDLIALRGIVRHVLMVACSGEDNVKNGRFIQLKQDYILQPDRNDMQRSVIVNVKFGADALRGRTKKEECAGDDEDWVYTVI
uniref:non-specific serine/threonine protein kinase n=1 Tax=Panagrellus redivivus TaxID=6233 RepID=A0A7E4WA01_PANRE